jgi:hypothetical protein
LKTPLSEEGSLGPTLDDGLRAPVGLWSSSSSLQRSIT